VKTYGLYLRTYNEVAKERPEEEESESDKFGGFGTLDNDDEDDIQPAAAVVYIQFVTSKLYSNA
jgi:hypothetical protein